MPSKVLRHETDAPKATMIGLKSLLLPASRVQYEYVSLLPYFDLSILYLRTPVWTVAYSWRVSHTEHICSYVRTLLFPRDPRL